jgi:hypothetical protein
MQKVQEMSFFLLDRQMHQVLCILYKHFVYFFFMYT